MSFEKNLDKYAKLAIKVGVNIQEATTGWSVDHPAGSQHRPGAQAH